MDVDMIVYMYVGVYMDVNNIVYVDADADIYVG